MLDRKAITEKIRISADRYGPSNPQQLKQLLFGCEKATERELFFGLFSFFYEPSLQENAFARQQLAGTILLKISPKCPLELEGAIYATPKYWDLSIEEMPWYLCKEFGKEVVQEFLVELLPDVEDEELKQSFKTMLFWAKGYKDKIT
ncbi:hypothetical protein ACVBEJ_11925 [Porticoccus sp. GXU_MW_L64]